MARPRRAGRSVGGMGRFRAWLRALSVNVPIPAERVPRTWTRCPICDERLVGPWPAGYIGTDGMGGRAVAEPARAELVAKCPVHGHRPYNDPDHPPPYRQLAYDEPDPLLDDE